MEFEGYIRCEWITFYNNGFAHERLDNTRVKTFLQLKGIFSRFDIYKPPKHVIDEALKREMMAETKPNLRDIFRKPAASSNQAQVRKETAQIKDNPSTKKSSKNREHSEGERLDDEYGTRKKTSSTTRVTGKIRNKGEPEKKSADDFMAIFQQTTLGERPEKDGLKNNLSSQRSSSDDSEEDEENQTPKSSVSSGSRSYPSKDKTEPSPDDPFKRLQAGMKDNSEEDDKKQTVTRHTSKSSVSSGSRSNLSKDKTVPSPDDPFTTLQAEIKADDSEEDDENQTVSRHTPKSRVSSGSRKYQSKKKTVPSPDDPFTRLQAGMKADDSEKDDENQTVTRNTPTSSVSSGSRKYQSKDNTVPSPDDPFTRLQAGMKADDSEEDDKKQTFNRHTPKSSVSSGSLKYQSNDKTVPSPDDPFTRLQAGMKRNAQDKGSDEHGQTQSVYENEESFSDDSSQGSLSDNADASTQDDHFKRLVESTKDTNAKETRSAKYKKDETESSSSDDSDDNVQPGEEYNPFRKMVADVNRPKSKPGHSKHPSRKPSDDSTSNGADRTPDIMSKRKLDDLPPSTSQSSQGNFSTSNPAFKTYRMFEDFAGMANGAEEEEKKPITIGSSMAKPRGGLGGAHNDQLRPSLGAQSQASAATGGAPLNQSVSSLGAHNPGGAAVIATSNSMSSLFGGHNLGSAGRGSVPSNQMAPFLGEQNLGSAGRGSSPANQVSPLLGAQNRGGAGAQNPMAQMQRLQQMLGGKGGQNPMAQFQMLKEILGGQAGKDPMAQLNMLQQMMGGQAINIENRSDDDIIRRILQWETIRAQSNPLKKDPNGTTTLLIVDTSGKMAGDAMIQTEQFLDTFMAGLEHQQKNLNMQENVAVITVGTFVEVKQHLTNNYPKIREALHCLCAEGPSKLHFGLRLSQSIVQAENGGIKDFGGHAAAPRVILISDGRITGHTDGLCFPDEREHLQNVTLESLNMMIQMTLTQVFCIPVGQSDNGFLELISSITGGKTMDRKCARVLSRYHIYHTVVASLKQHQTEPTTDSIRHQLVTVAQTYDDDDMAEVLYLWRQPEPDIQGRNQRPAQQEEELSRRRQAEKDVTEGEEKWRLLNRSLKLGIGIEEIAPYFDKSKQMRLNVLVIMKGTATDSNWKLFRHEWNSLSEDATFSHKDEWIRQSRIHRIKIRKNPWTCRIL
ncbi:uncharacterized protein LOC127876067 isoform X11 [Dreissena polymorpha]|uniref:uncharacterized protein LOC127876067 isoform X11 n=2 Tax=Dreissena polymorpha TaxID=45954 RepID=UPI00226414AE|nr:uncharacterized protein LOC127876067 isoform X11 [Dreissena polymorpha]